MCSKDGAARIGATLFSELLNAVFANVGQRAVRKVARETFEHLLNLDLKFHLSRQTGGLTRAIDRGTKYASSHAMLNCMLNVDTEVLRSSYKLYSSGLCPPRLKYPWFAESWCATRTFSEEGQLAHFIIDVQVWVGLRCHCRCNDGRIHVVYYPNYIVEASKA